MSVTASVTALAFLLRKNSYGREIAARDLTAFCRLIEFLQVCDLGDSWLSNALDNFRPA